MNDTDAATKTSGDSSAQSVGMAAQIALYPLRQPSLSSVIDATVRIFREHGPEVQPGPMITLVSGDSALVFRALQRAFEAAAVQAETVMVATMSNACRVPARTGEIR